MNRFIYCPRYILSVLLILALTGMFSCSKVLNNSDNGSTTGTDSTAAVISVAHITGVSTTATAGTVLTLIGTVEPSDATNQTIVWSITDAGNTGATITGTNALNTTAAGTVTVKATITDGIAVGTDYTKDFKITVVAAFVPIADITGVPATAADKKNLTLNGIVEPSDATNQMIVWSVTDAGNTGATINGNTLHTTASGTLIIKATVTDGTAVGTDYTKDFTITSDTPVTRVTLKNAVTLKIGNSETLLPVISPLHATNKNVTWTSSAPSVASVNNDGLITANSAGSAIITVTTEDGNFTADCTVDVLPLTVTGVSLNKKTTTIKQGDTETLTASIKPVNATNQAVLWTSSDSNIVTVDSDGAVTAVSTGKAIVTVTTMDGHKTAACEVTVSE